MKILEIPPCSFEEEQPAKKSTILVKNIAVTVCLLAAVVIIVQLLSAFRFDTEELILIYTLFIVIISRVTPGYVYGVVSAVVSAFFYAFLSIPPPGTFQFGYKFTLTVFMMLVVTLATSIITARMKNVTELALKREHRAELLFEMNQELLATRDLESIVVTINKYLLTHLQRSVITFIDSPSGEKETYFTAFSHDATAEEMSTKQEQRLAVIAYRSQEPAGYTTINPMGSRILYLPLLYHDQTLGVIGVSCLYKELQEEHITFLHLLVAQASLALELQRLDAEKSSARTEAEKEKMRSSLLRAISHDLRTPLTGILGASSTLIENEDLEQENRQHLLMDIKDSSEWLIRMVENLLSVTRISDSTMRVSKVPEAAEEVIGQAVSIIRSRFPDHAIHVKVPDELLLVPMDATLISQVLINLLENAVKNSTPDNLVLVNLKKDSEFALFEVSDYGVGIPEELLESLFEVHPASSYRSADASKGIGIGLSICETIIHAHGGEIEGHNKASGGALFSFWLPLKGASL